jgi:hypothetical protein
MGLQMTRPRLLGDGVIAGDLRLTALGTSGEPGKNTTPSLTAVVISDHIEMLR